MSLSPGRAWHEIKDSFSHPRQRNYAKHLKPIGIESWPSYSNKTQTKSIHNRAAFETEIGLITDKNFSLLQMHNDRQS